MPELIILVVALIAAGALVVLVRSTIARVTVFEYQRGLKYRNGRLVGVVEPGRYWIYRPSDHIQLVEMRQSVMTVPGQEVVTSDGVSIKLSLAVRQRVGEPVVALTQVDDFQAATYTIIQVALRETTSAIAIDDLLQRRDEVGTEVLRRSADRVRELGVNCSQSTSGT